MGPSRSHPGSEVVPSRFAMCFVLQCFGPIQVPRWGPSRPVLVPSCSRAFLTGSGLDGQKQTSWPLPSSIFRVFVWPIPRFRVADFLTPLFFLWKSEPPKRGQKIGAARKLSKSVENCFDIFLTIFDVFALCENCRKVSKLFLTLFDDFWRFFNVAPFLLRSAEEREIFRIFRIFHVFAWSGPNCTMKCGKTDRLP